MIPNILGSPALICVPVFISIMLALEFGRRLGRSRLERHGDGRNDGASAIDAAVFGFFGLLVAFTFSGAASRFDARRDLVVEEVNDIGTAYLRLDLLSPAAQPALRDAFRRYADSRLDAYRQAADPDAFAAALARSTAIQNQIWRLSVDAGREAGVPTTASMLLLPALNAMFDITTTRAAAFHMHPPWPIFALLMGMALTAALLAGYATAESPVRNWLHMLSFAAVVAIATYVIVDIEFPRQGYIRVDDFDALMSAERAAMDAAPAR